MRTELALRFDYGRLVPWITQPEKDSMRATVGPHSAILRTKVPLSPREGNAISEFTVDAGEQIAFVLTYRESHLPPADPVDAQKAQHETERHWQDWSRRCSYHGPWSEAIMRSLITIKAMSYRPTGGIVAAPTTSLPEQFGGSRNWDYRYCWLRDATFMISCLLKAGYHDEARPWRDWLLRAIAGMPSQIQPTYGIGGEHRLNEWEVSWLPGFNVSGPIRVGNAAFSQFQLDVFGEVMNALHLARHSSLAPTEDGWNLQKALIAHLEEIWTEPDDGIWEVRADAQHFTHSKVMAWVAVDRAIKAVEQFDLAGPVQQWKTVRAKIHEEVCTKGFDHDTGVFVQAFGSKHLDSSTLLFPIVGFLPANDPRILATVRAIERELMQDGLVLRYDTHKAKDGLAPGEGAFLACSFWLAENYALQHRRSAAQALFERLLSLRNDVGLLAEEYNPSAKTFLGNFPQALSHLALVNTAHSLADENGSTRASLNP